ncbi:MAG TPA: DUF1579 family protein [Terriglobales bacterium]|nr:DUF1579 family protein [Terriglobales bacterium]
MYSALRSLLLVVAVASACVAQTQPNNPSPHEQAAPCMEPEQKQLDFWVGEWELTWPENAFNKAGRGTNNVQRTLDGCVVQECFSGGDSMLRGLSASTYDARAGKWKQTWVDNQGGYLDFVGEFKNDQMILGREARRPDGTKIQQRMVFKNIAKKSLDWSWERSLDGGKTWQVVWPIHYQRKPE